MKNSGLIIEHAKEDDYIFGGNTKLVKTILSSNGNYIEYIPITEMQIGIYFDTMACVSFSAINVIEIIFKYHLKHGNISKEDIKWLEDNGYFQDGELNFSDRFIAKLSNTTKQGNTGRKVAKTIVNYGLIPESKWSYPSRQRTPVFVWEDYYKEIPEELLKLGKEFKERFSIGYEAIYRKDMKDALKYGPIQVYVCAWYKNDTGLFYKPKDRGYNHAVTRIQSLTKQIFDSYEPYIKSVTLDEENYYPSGYLYILKVKKMKLVKTNGSSTVYLIDMKGIRRAFYDEQHFNMVAPILGLAKYSNDNNLKTDWSQVETISVIEMDTYPLGRPLVLIQ